MFGFKNIMCKDLLQSDNNNIYQYYNKKMSFKNIYLQLKYILIDRLILIIIRKFILFNILIYIVFILPIIYAWIVTSETNLLDTESGKFKRYEQNYNTEIVNIKKLPKNYTYDTFDTNILNLLKLVQKKKSITYLTKMIFEIKKNDCFTFLNTINDIVLLTNSYGCVRKYFYSINKNLIINNYINKAF